MKLRDFCHLSPVLISNELRYPRWQIKAHLFGFLCLSFSKVFWVSGIQSQRFNWACYELKIFIFHIFGIFFLSLCFHVCCIWVQKQLGNKKKTKMLSIHPCRFNCGELKWKWLEYKCHREDYFEVFYQIFVTIMRSVNSECISWEIITLHEPFSSCDAVEWSSTAARGTSGYIGGAGWRSL